MLDIANGGGGSSILNEFVVEPSTLLARARLRVKRIMTHMSVGKMLMDIYNVLPTSALIAPQVTTVGVCAPNPKCNLKLTYVFVCVCHFRRIGHACDTTKGV